MREISIREAQPDDLFPMMVLAQKAPMAAQWPENIYAEMFNHASSRTALVCFKESAMLGFMVHKETLREWEIETIVVEAGSQRTGIATSLVEELVRLVKERKGIHIHLEVRSQNISAIAFYKKLKFHLVGKRKDYYSNPTDDALLFRLEL